MTQKDYGVLAAALVLTVGLSGCGGGGSDGMMSDTAEPTLTIPRGMTASAEAPIHAQDADDTIAMLLPDSTRQFAPVSSRARMDEFHVKAFASDGNNGFVVTYVVAGQEYTVHFEANDYGTPRVPFGFHTETADGGRFWLWSNFGFVSEEEKNQGSRDFEYLDIYNSWVDNDETRNHQHLVFGARTETTGLPAGTATYSGRMYARNLPEDYDNFARLGSMRGNWRLVADFSESKLQGDIRRISVRRPGEDYYRYLPYTTYFRISNGEIVDGRFTASVSGVDLAENAPPDTDTVRGFSGSILGEFYGPEAEEAGGVLRASRASDSRVLVGSFGGDQAPELDVTIPMGDLGRPLSVAVDRDSVTETVQAATATEVTAIESDGANGFHVTYTVDGVDQRIHLEDDDYQKTGNDRFGFVAHTADGFYRLEDLTGAFVGTPEFDHFNVHEWRVTSFTNEGTPASIIPQGYVVYGIETEAADLPAGTATYEGQAHLKRWLTDSRRRFGGRLMLNADFDASTVGGAIDQLTGLDSTLTSIAIENGEIREGEIYSDLRGSQGGASFDGELTGRFYGSQAAEVGGVLEGSYTDSQVTAVVQGWFGGTKQ